jgi:hypothetical protein
MTRILHWRRVNNSDCRAPCSSPVCDDSSKWIEYLNAAAFLGISAKVSVLDDSIRVLRGDSAGTNTLDNGQGVRDWTQLL